ncbi:MAG: family 43 glycosylhydrolase [Oscillospiraceae bacterium]|nr:family 43 glycosylhydrolase [Oscillospiraceae bacterium]
MKLTYCNPLKVENVGNGRWLDFDIVGNPDLRSSKDYRSISDPSVIYHDGKWIMYPSYKLAYVSEDFVNWKHVDIGIDNLRYSPAVANFRGKWYLSGHGMSEMYVADDPLGPFELCGNIQDMHGNIMEVADGCYLVDGDHLYFYWCKCQQPENGEDVELVVGTVGAECDPDEPWKLISEPVWINKFNPSKEWERHGEYNQNERIGWTEGQWMLKIGERYYLLYSGSGTQYSSYATGILYSDEGPLSGFKRQEKHDPLTRKPYGLMRGAGHGSIAEGPNGTYWIFYTNIFCYNFCFERRISMDPLGIDENGELYCPALTETPQFAPGVLENPEKGNSAGLLPLTFYQSTEASSCAPGRASIYAADDNFLSWWQPEKGDTEPTLEIDLGAAKGYNIEAMRIIWRDIEMETLDGINPGPFKYVAEYKAPDSDEWKAFVDASDNECDLCVDYRQFEKVTARYVRLRIVGAPEGITPGVCSFTVFGKCAH